MNPASTEIIVRAIIRRDGQLLLAKQRTQTWSFLPGGHVEPGEGVEVALIREITEELGTKATITGFAGAVEHGYVEDDVAHHELNLVFDVAIADTGLVSREDHLEFHWLPLDHLASTDIRPGALKNVLLSAGHGSGVPFWHSWSS